MAQAPCGRKRKATESPVVASPSTQQEECSLLERYMQDRPGPANILQWVCTRTQQWLDAPTNADEALYFALGKLSALANEADQNQGLRHLAGAQTIYAQTLGTPR